MPSTTRAKLHHFLMKAAKFSVAEGEKEVKVSSGSNTSKRTRPRKALNTVSKRSGTSR